MAISRSGSKSENQLTGTNKNPNCFHVVLGSFIRGREHRLLPDLLTDWLGLCKFLPCSMIIQNWDKPCLLKTFQWKSIIWLWEKNSFTSFISQWSSLLVSNYATCFKICTVDAVQVNICGHPWLTSNVTTEEDRPSDNVLSLPPNHRLSVVRPVAVNWRAEVAGTCDNHGPWCGRWLDCGLWLVLLPQWHGARKRNCILIFSQIGQGSLVII